MLSLNNYTLSEDYNLVQSSVRSLYELSKEKAWNANQVAKKFGGTKTSNTVSTSILDGFAPYESLAEEDKRAACVWLELRELSEILHGEQLAMLTASQLSVSLPTLEAKIYSSSQAMEEARHIEFFAGYFQSRGFLPFPPSREMTEITHVVLCAPDWDYKLLALQVIIENIALGKFQRIMVESRDSALVMGIKLVAKDEARHCSFGMSLLKKRLRELGESERALRVEFVIMVLEKLINQSNVYLEISDVYGWDRHKLLCHFRKRRISKEVMRYEMFSAQKIVRSLKRCQMLDTTTALALRKIGVVGLDD